MDYEIIYYEMNQNVLSYAKRQIAKQITQVDVIKLNTIASVKQRLTKKYKL